MEPLTAAQRDLVRGARRAVLATTAPDGRSRLVPMTFAIDDSNHLLLLYSALDDKPKTVADPRDLARVRDIAARPRVTVLMDRWSEDWAELAWVRLYGTARLIGPDEQDVAEHARAVQLLRAKYSQYAGQALELRPIIRIEVETATSWRAAS